MGRGGGGEGRRGRGASLACSLYILKVNTIKHDSPYAFIPCMEKHFTGDHIGIFSDFKTHTSLGIFCVRYNYICGLILLLTIYSSLAL